MQTETGASLTTPQPQRRSRHHLVVLALVAVTAVLLDQVTKAWAVAVLSDGLPRPVIGEFLQLRLIRNPGAAFSIGNGSTWLMTLIACAILGVVVWASRRIRSTGWAWALGLILGGAVGNLIDRMLREPGPGRGHVVDFLDYNGWFIGNVADIAIVGAALVIVGLSMRGITLDGHQVTTDDD